MAKSATAPKSKSGDMREATGAGPSLAAHSKDAKTPAKSGQAKKASSKN